MLKLKLRGKVQAFTDNTVIVFRVQNQEKILENFNHDVRLLQKWFWKNGLHLNAGKYTSINYDYKKIKENNMRRLQIHKWTCDEQQ